MMLKSSVLNSCPGFVALFIRLREADVCQILNSVLGVFQLLGTSEMCKGHENKQVRMNTVRELTFERTSYHSFDSIDINRGGAFRMAERKHEAV